MEPLGPLGRAHQAGPSGQGAQSGFAPLGHCPPQSCPLQCCLLWCFPLSRSVPLGTVLFDTAPLDIALLGSANPWALPTPLRLCQPPLGSANNPQALPNSGSAPLGSASLGLCPPRALPPSGSVPLGLCPPRALPSSASALLGLCPLSGSVPLGTVPFRLCHLRALPLSASAPFGL